MKLVLWILLGSVMAKDMVIPMINQPFSTRQLGVVEGTPTNFPEIWYDGENDNSYAILFDQLFETPSLMTTLKIALKYNSSSSVGSVSLHPFALWDEYCYFVFPADKMIEETMYSLKNKVSLEVASLGKSCDISKELQFPLKFGLFVDFHCTQQISCSHKIHIDNYDINFQYTINTFPSNDLLFVIGVIVFLFLVKMAYILVLLIRKESYNSISVSIITQRRVSSITFLINISVFCFFMQIIILEEYSNFPSDLTLADWIMSFLGLFSFWLVAVIPGGLHCCRNNAIHAGVAVVAYICTWGSNVIHLVMLIYYKDLEYGIVICIFVVLLLILSLVFMGIWVYNDNHETNECFSVRATEEKKVGQSEVVNINFLWEGIGFVLVQLPQYLLILISIPCLLVMELAVMIILILLTLTASAIVVVYYFKCRNVDVDVDVDEDEDTMESEINLIENNEPVIIENE